MISAIKKVYRAVPWARPVWHAVYPTWLWLSNQVSNAALELLYRVIANPACQRNICVGSKLHGPALPSVLHYNRLGRQLMAAWELLCFFLFPARRAIRLEHFDQIDYAALHSGGRTDVLWPTPPLYEKPRPAQVDDALMARLRRSYDLAYEWDTHRFPLSPIWQKSVKDFHERFFDEAGSAKGEALANFRRKQTGAGKPRAGILMDQMEVVDPEVPFWRCFLKAVNLVRTYHNYSAMTDLTVLRSASESFAGNNLCVVYRGQRLSGRLIRHAYYVSQITRLIEFSRGDSPVFLDLGGAYGGLARQLLGQFPKAKAIVVELPEVCVFAGYFLSDAFPGKKVGLLGDLPFHPQDNPRIDIGDYDILVLPTWAIEYLPANSVDVVSNTTSMGEMSREFGEFYIAQIERICRGYFYSNNVATRDESEGKGEFGYHTWPFADCWMPIHYGRSLSCHHEVLLRKRS